MADFAQAMTEERNRLSAEKEILVTEIDVLKNKMSGIDKELKALDAYERAKSGSTTTGTRRKGVRKEVLDTVAGSSGMSRADVLEALDVKGDAKATQSVSNALAALKKDGKIVAGDDGNYTAA